MSNQRIIVVGGGLAGLMTTIKIAEAGVAVDLFSLVPVKRSHSVCAQGGINGAVNTRGEGDSPWEHFDDTVYGGDFLANQKQVLGMCEAAPGIIHLLDRMGVMFNRTPEGLLDFRRFGGTKQHRTAFAGASTGQQLLYALDEQVRRHEVAGLVQKYEGWDFIRAILDEDGTCRGIVVQDLRSMEIKSFRADAVVMCTGGIGMIFGKSTNSMINTGSATSILYQQGVKYGNPEMIQVHPTAIPGDDKLRLMSESARGEGARVWTYKDGKPWYFLEEMYPEYGNLVPRDIATRAIFDVCVTQGLGVNGENQVYLDLSHMPPEVLNVKLGNILDIYEKFVGDDPRKVPMRIFPGMHYSMGGLWVDINQQTNIKGLFAAGECEFQYHGANRLGANSLLSCIYGGMITGPNAVNYIQGLKRSSDDFDSGLFDNRAKEEQDKFEALLKMEGTENPYQLHRELGKVMTDNVTVVRFNDRLQQTDEKIQELMARYQNINMADRSRWENQMAQFTRHLWNMFEMSRAVTIGALMRDESRGAHFKPDFPDRNDERFMKSTIATWTQDGPEISYEDIDVSLLPPRKRNYAVSKEATAQ